MYIINIPKILFTRLLLYGMDRHEHEPILDGGEVVCRLCGEVLEERGEVINDYRDPHGKATLWQYAIGGMNKGKREDISVISNVCQRLMLNEAQSIEVLNLYRHFVKQEKDKVLALKLAILNIVERYRLRFSRKDVDAIVELNFAKKSAKAFEVEVLSKIASRFGASRIDCKEVLRWI